MFGFFAIFLIAAGVGCTDAFGSNLDNTCAICPKHHINPVCVLADEGAHYSHSKSNSGDDSKCDYEACGIKVVDVVDPHPGGCESYDNMRIEIETDSDNMVTLNFIIESDQYTEVSDDTDFDASLVPAAYDAVALVDSRSELVETSAQLEADPSTQIIVYIEEADGSMAVYGAAILMNDADSLQMSGVTAAGNEYTINCDRNNDDLCVLSEMESTRRRRRQLLHNPATRATVPLFVLINLLFYV